MKQDVIFAYLSVMLVAIPLFASVLITIILFVMAIQKYIKKEDQK